MPAHCPALPIPTSIFLKIEVLASGLIWFFLFFIHSLLQEARQQLNFDHRGKMEALEIDHTCVSLSVSSPNISYKVNPTRVPFG